MSVSVSAQKKKTKPQPQSHKRRALLIVAAVIGVGLGAVLGARVAGASKAKSIAKVPTLDVSRAEEAIVVDGHFEDIAWTRAARSGGFTNNGGAPARPYSDARFTWRDGMLFVMLYAADEDIRFNPSKHDDPLWTADAFSVVFTVDDRGGAPVQRKIDVSANGVVTDGTVLKNGRFDTTWESGAKVAVDRDGTANDSSDQDEEWVVEMSIPLASLGLVGKPSERFGVSVRRCDVLRGQKGRVCAQWPEPQKSMADETVLVLVE